MKKIAKLLTILMSAAIACTFWGCENPAASTDSENKTSQEKTVLSDLETPLTIEAATDAKIRIFCPWSTLKYKINDGSLQTPVVQYPGNDYAQTSITVAAGDKVSFYANGSENDIDNDYIQNIKIFDIDEDAENTLCYYYGNIMSLLDAENFATKKVIEEAESFAYLFADGYIRLKNHATKKLILPATTLSDYCYAGLFEGCESITESPELPATELKTGCYSEMFHSCYALTEAPELPSETLAPGCYYRMFDSCKSLERAPDLTASLLVTSCYGEMFYNCKILNYVKCLATNISAEDCTSEWLSRVAATGTFLKANGVTWTRDENGIPASWTEETPIPEYTIAVTGGTAKVNGNTVTKATAGTEITLTANAPETGKEFDVWLGDYDFLNEGDNEHHSTLTFTMPAGNVSLTANFEFIDYAITVASGITNGSLSVSSTANYGETVTVTATPHEYYALDSISVTNNGSALTLTGEGNTRTFTMPAASVTVTATFKITPIGTKNKPTEVGDIIFNDGTALPASVYNNRELIKREKENSIAIVASVNGNKCLTVGLLQYPVANLCDSNSIGNTNTVVFSCNDSSKTRDYICNGKDNIITDYNGGDNYPAMLAAQNYKGKMNNLKEFKKNNWLIPTKDELLAIYNNKSVLIAASEKIGNSYATIPFVNETTSHYLTVTQGPENDETVYRVNLSNGECWQYQKTYGGPVLFIRYF